MKFLFWSLLGCLVPYHTSRGTKIVLILGYWEQYFQATCKSLTYRCFSNSHLPMSYVKGGEGSRPLGTKVVHNLLSATSYQLWEIVTRNLHSTVFINNSPVASKCLRWLADYWYATINYIYQCSYLPTYETLKLVPNCLDCLIIWGYGTACIISA